MSALALIARSRGVAVTGSDADVSGCGDLRKAGAEISEGSAPEQVRGARAVIVSAAVPTGHPDLEAARVNGIPIVPRKVALAELVATGRCVGIAGTHGKTTTTVMTTEAVAAAGLAVTGIAGGRVESWGGNARIAGTEHDLFVVEADEFDQAFLTLQPEVAVITNIEADHLECYGSLDALEQAFVTFAGRAKRILVGNDSAGAERVAAAISDSRVWRYGPGAGEVRIDRIEQSAVGSRATITLPDQSSVPLELRVPGLHNLRNATAAIGVVAALGADPRRALPALSGFGGVGRRFERLGDVNGVAVVDDYAHHPTEIRATLQAARQAFPDRRLVAVFQPHLFSRTRELGPEMGAALSAADLAVVTDVYAAREQPIPGVSGETVAAAVRNAGGQVAYEPNRGELARRVHGLIRAGDLLLTLGAGDITRLPGEMFPELVGRDSR